MKILYKDFIRHEERGFLGVKRAPMSDALDDLNDWIRRNNIDVFNVETIFEVSGEYSSTAQTGIRCWYREQAAQMKRPL